jgi:hypothetical protein
MKGWRGKKGGKDEERKNGREGLRGGEREGRRKEGGWLEISKFNPHDELNFLLLPLKNK